MKATELEARVKTLNTILKKPLVAYTKLETKPYEGNKYRANVGNFSVAHCYSHFSLQEIVNDQGGVHVHVTGTKQDIACYIAAYLTGYQDAKKGI